MDNKGKTKLKIEILNDIKNCFSFDFGVLDETLNKIKIQKMLNKYEEEIDENCN